MSVFGKPTIDETRHLMRTIEFRIERTEALMGRMPFAPENVVLIRDWNTWNERWAKTRETVLRALLARKLANPNLSDDLIVCPSEYALVEHTRGTLHEPISLPSLIRRFEKATGERLDEEGAPVPTGFDPDHAAYKAVDEKIRAAEAAASAAGNAARATAGDFFASNPGLVVLGALGLVGATVVAVKVYL